MENKGIIFDLDGTLWEVTNMTYQSANEICRKYNLKEVTLDTICSVFGKNREDSAKSYFPYLDLNEAKELIDEISTVNINNLNKYGGNVYENLEETLKKLENDYKLFIVSNTGHNEYIEAFLVTSNLKKYFTDYIAASAINVTKAKGIKMIIDKYNLNQYVYVGDTHIDFEAANAENVPFIHAKYGFEKTLDAQYFIDKIEDLPDVVKEIKV